MDNNKIFIKKMIEVYGNRNIPKTRYVSVY